jgi:hypothetical protein
MIRIQISQAASSIVAMIALGACTTSGAGATTADNTALTAALVNATSASGTLACAPTTTQVDACSGKAASDSCVLTLNSTSVAGTCRTSIDGSIGCAPNPPAPPAAAVSACDGKAQDDACTIADTDADVDAGVCTIARDGTTLACARTFTPPQVAIDACASKASGDACAMTGHEGRSCAGACSTGPAGDSSVLACRPAGKFPDAAAACADLAAGAACTMSAGHEHGSGVCTADTTGAVVCVLPCGGHEGGPRGDGHGSDDDDDHRDGGH